MSSPYSKNIINLIILSIAIILILVTKNSVSSDSFVANVPVTPIGNGGNIPYFVPGSQPIGQPMRFREDVYPAKIPWYPEYDRPCSGQCGATGVCVDGICQNRTTDKTAFNVRV